MKKFTAKTKSAQWIDSFLKQLMKQRDEGKLVTVKSGLLDDRLKYCKLRNQVTKLNKRKKKEYYRQIIDRVKHDGKRLWNNLNEIMGRKDNACASFVESDGMFLTKPQGTDSYFNMFFINKVNNLRQGLGGIDTNPCELICNEIMDGKNCMFPFKCVEDRDVKILLKSLPEYGSAGTDNLDNKVLSIAADYISGPISHIVNTCLLCGVYPRLWKEGKIIPLLKDNKLPFSGPNNRPISILPALNKVMERIIHVQVQDYFNNNNLITKYQHAYRKSYSSCTALIQMTDDWLRGIADSKIAGAVILDFSAAFDVIDHDI